MANRLRGLGVWLACAVIAGGCAAGQAFRQGDAATRRGDLDQAVSFYRRAAQSDPDNPRYKITLERAMQAASRYHLDRAHEFERQDQLEAALGEYRLAAENDPSNRGVATKIASMEKTLRDRAEAERPKPAGQQLREQARAASASPILNPASRQPRDWIFNNVAFKDILNFIGDASGINISYDREVVDRPTTLQLNGATVEQAINQVMAMNQLSYKVVNERSIFVFADTPAKHTQYDEQVIRTFYIQHADVTELSQLLSSIIRLPNIAVQPAISFSKNANSMTIRASTTIMAILERVIEQNDKPRAEIVFDIEILEVDRERAKTYGLNLSEFALGAVFSPEVSPNGATTAPATGTTAAPAAGTSTPPSGLKSPPPFNLNTISRGISTADFYLAVPTAVMRALESDTKTRLLAKPQLRGAEGAKLTLNLGQEVPIVTTSYTPIATGGVGTNPLNSFQLKPVGINIDITPRVTLDGDILIELNVESSSEGTARNVAGTNYPSFVSRKVGTRLRLRDGESNLLAGLLREDESAAVQGFPGAIHVPLLSQAFSSNDNRKSQIDLIMLLTPHIVRTSEITESDLRPIYIGSQQNLGLGGPPPLIAPTPEPDATPASPFPAPPRQTTPGAAPGSTPGAPTTTPGAAASPSLTPPGTTLAPPPGSSPVPGLVVVPAQPQPPAAQPNAPAGQTTPGAPATQTPGASPQSAAPGALTLPTGGPPSSATASAQGAASILAAPPAPTLEPLVTQGVGSAQVLISPPPGTAFRVGQGPYTVPLTIVNAARLSMVTLTLTYDAALLRVRAVQEGSFMRTAGATATFTQQVSPGRVDVILSRSADANGASGTGLLAALVFDAIAPGTATLTLSGTGSGPGNTPMGLQFRPVTIAVQ
ncbi:MAG: cohesin domain-containing protein [Acidobacteriota bacterium]